MLIKAPVKEWKPISRPQEIFLSLPDTIREAFFGGAAGPGKSECLMMYPIVRKFIDYPRFKAVFMRRTYKELEREIIPRSKQLYEAFGGKLNKSSLCYEFESGATIWFGHCEHETDVSQYDSMEINLFLPDELESFLEYQYLYIGFTRVRTSDPALPAIIRAAGMPGGIGHAWVKKRFIDPCPGGNRRIIGRSGNERIYIHSTLADNPIIDKGYAQSLEELPEAEKRAKKFGDWSSYEGQVFSEFRERHYPNEPDNAVHIVDKFDVPSWWPRILAIDWGFKAMCSVGHAAISPSRRLYVYRHQKFFSKKIEEWGPEVKYWIEREKHRDAVICHSAGQHRSDPHTIHEQVQEALGIPIRLGERDRIGGKQLLHEYLRWEQKTIPLTERQPYDPDLAAWLLRNKGIIDYKNYLASFDEVAPEKNLPKLQFFDDPDVKLICDAVKACVYEKSTTNGKSKEDVAEFAGDDPYDMLRLLIHAADAYFNTAEEEQVKLDRVSEVVARLEATGDMTQYYRNMRSLESREHVQPVMVYHHARNYQSY